MTKPISNIIFSKNRPLQLQGYLNSLYRYFPKGIIQSYLIYKRDLFDNEYVSVFRQYPEITVIREQDFRSDLLRILDQIDSRFILFGIDDVVYFDSVEFGLIESCFDQFADDIFGFSLRHGHTNVPEAEIFENKALCRKTIYSFKWTEGKTKATSYPFELCATIYRTDLVKKIIRSSCSKSLIYRHLFSPKSLPIRTLNGVISTRSILKSFGFFFNPNTLESWNCRWCKRNPSEVPHSLYFQKLCACAIQVNVVNTSTNTDMNTRADLTVESLNRKFQENYQLDLDYIAERKPMTTHSGPELFRLCKG